MYEGDPYGEEIDGEGGANEDDKNDGLNALVRKKFFSSNHFLEPAMGHRLQQRHRSRCSQPYHSK